MNIYDIAHLYLSTYAPNKAEKKATLRLHLFLTIGDKNEMQLLFGS